MNPNKSKLILNNVVYLNNSEKIFVKNDTMSKLQIEGGHFCQIYDIDVS